MANTTEELEDKAVELFDQGYSINSIGSSLRVSKEQAYRLVKYVREARSNATNIRLMLVEEGVLYE